MQQRQTDSARAVAAAVEELAAGRAILLVHERTKTGHLIASAPDVDVETLELMSIRGRGVLRAAMPSDRMRALGLAGIATSQLDGRLYAAPVDLAGHDRVGSLADRVATVRALASPETAPDRLMTPGHVFPVEADPRGCLAVGQLPEAAYDLARLAGGLGVGLYADLAEPAQAPVDGQGRERLGAELGVAVASIRDLIVDLERASAAVRRIVSAELPTLDGELVAIGYRSNRTQDDYIAFVEGNPAQAALPVYVHSRCPVSDVFGGLACKCGRAPAGRPDPDSQERPWACDLRRSGLWKAPGTSQAVARSPGPSGASRPGESRTRDRLCPARPRRGVDRSELKRAG
jgi:3,4-dihydroxy 2-butanone 4-phosphate synthase/GTP cyclohydrolase II